jgi:hypothetical protein
VQGPGQELFGLFLGLGADPLLPALARHGVAWQIDHDRPDNAFLAGPLLDTALRSSLLFFTITV